MRADKLNLQRIFEMTQRMEAPLFQRPYVWKQDPNWKPLWEAVESVAHKRLSAERVRPHFLGTIVLDQLETPTGKITARQIIDGQQRLTTLQIVLAAARDISQNHDETRYAQAFRKFTDNDVPLSDDEDDKFKVWPTNADREDFRKVMRAGSSDSVRGLIPKGLRDNFLIPSAYLYFAQTIEAWLEPTQPDTFRRKIDALYNTIREDLHIVVIDLEETDDPQVIFETLNALGTPLLPADLVKNYLFHLAQAQGHDIGKLYNQFWLPFDSGKGYWREEVRQGRLKRPRLDLYLNHYLTLMTGEEVSAAQMFSIFREFSRNRGELSPADHMGLFRSYAEVYQTFDSLPMNTREGMFLYRLRQLDTTTV